MAERPDIDQVRAFKKSRQWELMERYGAHALGIGRLEDEAQEKAADEPALLFYVERKDEAEGRIPAKLTFRPEGADEDVEVKTRIVESPQAQLEEG